MKNMNIRCSGCGALIQTKNKDDAGYIEQSVLDKRLNGNFYCKRCFDLKHYNKNTILDMDNDKYYDNLEKIKKDKGLIVYIVDLLDLDGTLLLNINDLYKSDNILLVANKVDLFLNSLNKNNIYLYLKKYLEKLNVKVKDIFLMSSFESGDIDLLIEEIKKNKSPRQNVYFVGMTNVGKSTILNKIIYKYTNEKDIITVSNNVNTTLDNIYIPFDDESYFVDTPGILNKESLIYFLDKDSYKAITPKSYIRPKTFQLNEKQSLFIAGFIRLDYVSGEGKTSFITNFNNSLLIHRTKLENADEFYDKHKDDILKYPSSSEREKLGSIVCEEIEITKDQKIDVAVFGIGFVSIYGCGKIRISSFEHVKWKVREAII
ncbi:MAG: ribosome biogenesis GTPase YqeH [Bacilli bacterium]|nr:ribosome biogenesis GTPase YqeH [Bacilli bacterium]